MVSFLADRFACLPAPTAAHGLRLGRDRVKAVAMRLAGNLAACRAATLLG